MLLYADPIMLTRISTLKRCHALLVMVAMLATPALPAAEPVAVGDVEVSATGEAGFAEAMRKVLVRVTGRREAAADPLFAALVSDASRYVQIVRPATATSAARVTLDSNAIGRAVERLGQPVWSSDRPVVLGVILSAPSGADPARVRVALEAAADERGLPLRLASAAAAGLRNDAALEPVAALEAARRAGADLALIGEADGAQWQWTLIDGVTSTVFPGDVAAGLQGAADVLALASQLVLSQPLAVTRVSVVGLSSLAAQRAAERSLASTLGVKRLEVLEVAADSSVFAVHSTGGERVLVETLAASPRLRRIGSQRDPLVYRYAP